jgi:uncharacterized membrane protein
VNDPGTAISVLGRLVRILSRWKDNPSADIVYQEVFVPPVSPSDLIADAFRPTARDGASLLEVQLRLQKALNALRDVAPDVFADPAIEMAADARSRARDALTAAEFRLLEEAIERRND